MKSKKLKFLEKILRFMATAVLRRHKPLVIGITGSVGKTSAKEAIFLVLSKKFPVRKNEKNYNNEVGIPLTIIGAESGGRSLLRWLGVFLKWAYVVAFHVKYPKIIIVELGIDRPGDMEYLTSFVKPSIGVVTNVSGSHLEFFGSLEKIAREKGRLVESLPQHGFAILNADDHNVLDMQRRTKSNVITYGFSEKASVRADMIVYNYDDNQRPEGISFKLDYDGNVIPVRLRHILAPHQIYSALAAIAIGTTFKINLIDATMALENFHSPQGRMNLIEGIKNTHVIDDTYNASPVSTLAALEVLDALGAKRKIAVLGDMLELGGEEEKGHRSVGAKVQEMDADIFVAVGKRMKKAVDEIKGAGFLEKKIFAFDDPESAGRKVQEIMREGDLVLVKGSQGMRMEKIVEEIMAEPLDAEKLLCRQSADWKKIKFNNP
ncbi:MAG: UDP-N-acetylmuramoyl-tripeptide-D-alanyl-D-alanine ligase [Candidatus Moranbacteria bacterium GW2011_GWE1_49_15]|nr:MAG: UDP-N-acetylmuramoyl-tripeptide-D-alanyl-D-alanine ligase [Candidatus Moranbacteria bacterium GW2011_GWE2_47_10]KKW06736.1 MAG: UDP-N-acetylmuramoyl-tripeptide-D-alanyl-D-alanine ligase [Candidatus Moranbacteria bacterium GW2011_GWE1_49_15]